MAMAPIGIRKVLAVAFLAMAQATPVVSVKDESRAVNAGISIMLLGSIGFMMGLFYLVNQEDKERRKYSWLVISNTISIFSAVLLFQAVNGLVEAYILEGSTELQEVGVNMVHFLVWLSILQFALAYLSGAVEFGRKSFEMNKLKLNTKCGGILLGHITGFAAINAFASLQAQVPRNFASLVIIGPLCWMTIFLLGELTDLFRYRIALGDDGKEDAREELWDEETAETEDDVVGLAASFVILQALRFAIGGHLPNPEGVEPAAINSSHDNIQVLELMGVGIAFVAFEFVRILYIPFKMEKITPQMKNVVAMGFAWCLFFSSDWFISGHFFIDEQGMMKEIVLALFVTAVALALIFVLDVIEGLDSTGHEVDTAVRAVIKAISVLIGFSWEKAFDTAVESITETITFMPPPNTKIILACLLALTVVPAWRMHILPTILEYEELEEAEEEEEEERVRAESDGRSLEAPLLEPEQQAVKKVSSTVGLGANALREKCSEYHQKIEVLEEQNRELKIKVDGSLVKEKSLGAMEPSSGNAELEQRNQALEKRNKELEASLGGISKELAELQKLADLLTN